MDDGPTGFHLHCENCIKVEKCSVRPAAGVSCPIDWCPQRCGARFHACKAAEHRLLCPDVSEACINAAFGCPERLARKHRGRHLQTCPASVVPCTAEWNRWPLCSRERPVPSPFTRLNPQLDRHQLDVALALRDQAMIDHWMTLPRKIQRLMRGPMTPRHPPVPLAPSLWTAPAKPPRNSTSHALMERENTDAFLEGNDVEGSPRQSAERSDTSVLSVVSTDDESPWGRRRKPPGLLQSVCSQLFNKRQIEKKSASGEPEPAAPALAEPTPAAPAPAVDDTLSDVSGDLNDSALDSAFDEDDDLLHPIAETQAEPAGLAVSSPAAPAPPLLATLGLDLSIECLPRYQHKPKSMYTFVCAHDFRRDEYPSHYRNWHSDIHGGLDGWLEQRCPLARYGCPFARRRLRPMAADSRVVYSPVVGSYGVAYASTLSPPPSDAESTVSLADLPFELLRTIAGFLDPFSLCHLALTCRLLRDVSLSLVHSRGLVVVQWQKTAQRGWRISHKRWSFSSSFSPVDRWSFEDGQHMADHMKTCRYYIKSEAFSNLPQRVQLPAYSDD